MSWADLDGLLAEYQSCQAQCHLSDVAACSDDFRQLRKADGDLLAAAWAAAMRAAFDRFMRHGAPEVRLLWY